MKQPTRRARKIGTAITTPIAIVAAAALVWQSSYAAFSGTTRNSGNSWSAGSVALTDDDNGVAGFQATNLVPGASGTKCIAITSTASVPSTVRGYVLNHVASSAGIENYIFVKNEQGTGGGFGSCTGFVPTPAAPTPEASLASWWASDSFAAGLGWDVPAGATTVVQRISWRFDATGLTQAELDGLQGSSTGVDFQWELQSN